ncbi:putative peptide transporter [Acorus gramineus]|uniref:Peptide transporter n=1 Tax=Acorus gramineus TaxID=55184 RepID=A0AAV9AQ77_ACOGR|nr:putative peptide transporter [Acorus gramineus]
MPFIMANEIFEKVASTGLLANMINYLTKDYHMNAAKGGTVLFLWSALSNFLPIFGASLSDSYLGRFQVITLGSFVSLAGMILLWLTAMMARERPPYCVPSKIQACEGPKSRQIALLFSAFALMSIGAGGIRPCSLAFGADQLDPKRERLLQSFFNWYYASVGVSIMVAVTVIVYMQDSLGWKVGFGVPTLLMLISAVLFLLGSSLYVKVGPNRSFFTGFAQVIAASIKNRRLTFPPNDVDGWYHRKKGSNIAAPSKKLRFLNKACLIRNPESDLDPDGSATDPWNLCTVEQVEEFKAIVKVIPIWSTGIVFAVTISQHSFPVLQANTMDRHIGPDFQIPAGSFSVFGILTLTIWVALYDRLIAPRLARLSGRARGLSFMQRMGAGLLVSCAATAVAAMVESARRTASIKHGLENVPGAVVDMSAMWLVPQHCLMGLAEALNVIGQIEFYYSEFPKSMSSVGVALFTLGLGVGNLLGALVVGVVDEVSRRGGGEGWVPTNLNRGHYDYYYWVLTLMSSVNFLYFIVCSWCYGSEGGGGGGGDQVEEEWVSPLRSPELSMIH